MERAINKANRLKQQYYLTGSKLDQQEYDSLIRIFSDIAKYIPPPPPDSSLIKNASAARQNSWQMASLAYYNLGLLKMERNDLNGAYDEFSQLIEHYGFKPHQVQSALFMQALARYKQKRYSEAVLLYNSVAQYYANVATTETDPSLEALESPLTAAKILKDIQQEARFESQLQRAISYYWNLLSGYQGTPLADAAIGKLAAAFLMGELADSAVTVLSRVKDAKTGNIPPLVQLNIANIELNNTKNYRAAENSYRQFLRNYPDHRLIGTAYLGLGTTLLFQDKYKEAREELAKIDKLTDVSNKTRSEAGYMRALSFEREDNWQRALGELDYIQANYPITPRGLIAPLHKANYYQSKGDKHLADEAFADAEKDYLRQIDIYSARRDIVAQIMTYLARCYEEQGKWTDVVDAYKTLASKYPDMPEGYAANPMAAEILASKLHEPAEAAEVLRLFIRTYPGSSDLDRITAYADSLERISR